MRLTWIAAGAALLLAAASAEATVVYKFSAADGRFTLLAPGPITAPTSYAPGQFASCTANFGCEGVDFDPGKAAFGGGVVDALRINHVFFWSDYYFAAGAFGQEGTHSSGSATLQVWTSAVLYEFSTALGSFALIAPDFVTTESSFAPDRLESCDIFGICEGVEFHPVTDPAPGGGERDSIRVNAFLRDTTYYFADGAFDRPGTYTGTGFDDATLKVTLLGTAVPEPAGWTMLIAGFGLAGAALRRGRSRRSIPATEPNAPLAP